MVVQTSDSLSYSCPAAVVEEAGIDPVPWQHSLSMEGVKREDDWGARIVLPSVHRGWGGVLVDLVGVLMPFCLLLSCSDDALY